MNNNIWHTISLVADDNGDNTFSQFLYVDGLVVASDLNIAYGGVTTIADTPFFFGRHSSTDGGVPSFTGDIAQIRFDNTPLSPAEITAAHANLLGTLEPIPEPSTLALLAACFGFVALRRRR